MTAPRTMTELEAMLPELYRWAIPHARETARRYRLLARLEPGELRTLADEGLIQAMQQYDGRASYKTYAQRCIEWRMLDYFRDLDHSRRKIAMWPLDEAANLAQPEPRQAVEADFWQRVNAALTERERRIVHWKYRRGKTNAEVGRRHGIGEFGVMRVMREHVRPKLRAALSDYAEVMA